MAPSTVAGLDGGRVPAAVFAFAQAVRNPWAARVLDQDAEDGQKILVAFPSSIVDLKAMSAFWRSIWEASFSSSSFI